MHTLAYSTGNQSASYTVAIKPEMIQSTRLAGYQALYEQAIMARVKVTYLPRLGSAAGGHLVMYIDRNPADTTENSWATAVLEKEKVQGRIFDELEIVYTPRNFTASTPQLINPGTTTVANICAVTSTCSAYDVTAVTDAAVVGDLVWEVDMLLIGRV
jgi:hypothetical protein